MFGSSSFDRDDYYRRDYEREQDRLRLEARYRFRELTEAELKMKQEPQPPTDDIPFSFPPTQPPTP